MYSKRGTGKIKKICGACGKEFIAWAYEKRKKRRFCSGKCRSKVTGFQNRNKIMSGKKHTKEWKIEARKRMIGNDWGFQKGGQSVFKGKRRDNLSGKNHWNWKGGIAPINQKIRSSLEYKLWEDSVLSRDSFTCQKCGEIRVSKLMAHHILNFSKFKELRFAIDNGIIFCRNCHNKFHKKYGIKNNNQEQIKKFLE